MIDQAKILENAQKYIEEFQIKARPQRPSAHTIGGKHAKGHPGSRTVP